MEKQSGEVFSEELLEDIRLEIEERKGDHLLDLYRETHPHLVMQCETPAVQLEQNVTAMEVDGKFCWPAKNHKKAEKDFFNIGLLPRNVFLILSSDSGEWGHVLEQCPMPWLLTN